MFNKIKPFLPYAVVGAALGTSNIGFVASLVVLVSMVAGEYMAKKRGYEAGLGRRFL